jgi:hypothetical protein
MYEFDQVAALVGGNEWLLCEDVVDQLVDVGAV